MTRRALGAIACIAAMVGFGARTLAQTTPYARRLPTPSPTPQARSITASPILTLVGAPVTFAYAPLAPRANTVTIAYGDGVTGTLARPSSATFASNTATGTHTYARASGPAGFHACVPATSYAALAVVTPVCVTVIVLAPSPSPTPSRAPSASPTVSASPTSAASATPTSAASATPSSIRLSTPTASPTLTPSASPPPPVRPTLAPVTTTSPMPTPSPLPTSSPTPLPTFSPTPSSVPTIARTAPPLPVVPTASATTTPARSLYPITGWTLSWANGLYAVDVPSGNGIPPAIAQITVGSAKRLIGQWIVDGLPAATQTRTQLVPGDVVTFEYDFPAQPAVSRDAAVHRIAFALLDPISSAPAGAPTAAPSIAYRYSIAPGSTTPTLVAAAPDPGTIAALQFDGFAVSVGHLSTGADGTLSGNGNAHLADLTFPVQFSGLIVGNAHATALGVTSDVTGGTATTTFAASCLRAPAVATNTSTDAAFVGQLGVFHRFSYAFSLMSASLQPLGAKSTATLCYAPPSVLLGDASALALGLANVQMDENGAFAFDLPGDGVPSWRMGDSPFVTIPTASVPYHFAFASDATTPHVSCDGIPATGPLLQALEHAPVNATATQCAWSPTGIDATIALATGTTLTTSDPFRFELVIDRSALSIANSVFAGGHVHGMFFVNRVPSPAPSASATPVARSFNASESEKSAAAFIPDDVGSAPGASDPSGTFDGTLSKSGDLVADAVPADWTTSSYLVKSTRATLFVPGGRTPYPSKGDEAGKTWAEIVRSLTIGRTPSGAPGFGLPGLLVAAGTLDRAPAATTAFDAMATGGSFGLVFVDGSSNAIFTSPTATVPRSVATVVGPKPTVTLVPGTTTLEVRWPAAPGYRGYILLRRDAAGNVITLDPLVRAFAYRDELAPGAHGDFAYALRVVTVHGVGPTGPFTSATLAP